VYYSTLVKETTEGRFFTLNDLFTG